MAIELPALVQRLVLDTSGFTRGAAAAEASFRKVATATEQAGGEVASSAQRNFTAAAVAAETAAKKSSASWKTAGRELSDVGKTMSTFVTLPLVGIAAQAVKTAGEFESTLNTMAAVAGVPGPELQKLGDLAKKMGADTVFSANESADAMLNLSKAGISTADIMGGALAATLNLAAAGELDLATAATVAGNAMNTFGLEGKDAAAIADALAGAANASSADVADLAMALSQGGLAANAAGLSIQETTAVLAAFADQGLRGSDAGTSMKSMLLRLVPSTKEAATTMADLGLKFTDANGAMLSISEVAEQLRIKTGNLTDEQRTNALQTIFGTDAYRAALVMSELGAAGLDKYTEATSKVGTAQEVADARMKGWAGTWEQFKGSLETAALSIGQVVIPAITPLVDKVKELADGFSSLNPEQAEAAVKLAAFAAAAGPALFVLGKIVGVTAAAAGGIQGIGLSMAAAAEAGGLFSGVMGKAGVALAGVGAGTVLAVVAGLVALGVAFVVAYKKSETFRDIVTGAWEKISGFFQSVWEGQLKPLFTDFGRVIDSVKPILLGLGILLGGAFVAAVVAAALAVKAALEGISLAVQVVAAVTETVGRNLGPIWGGIQKGASIAWRAMQAAWDGISGAVNSAWQSMNPVWQGIQSAWDSLTGAANTLWRAIQVAWDGITAAVVVSWQAINGVWQAIYGFMESVLNPAFRFLQAVWTDAWEAIRGFLREAWEGTIQPIWDAIRWTIDNVLIPVFNLLREGVATNWQLIQDAISFAWNSVILPIWDAIKWTIDNVLIPVFEYLREGNRQTWEAVGNVIDTVWGNVVKPVWEAIKSFIDGPLSSAFSAFRDHVTGVWDVFSSAASTAWDTVKAVIGGSLRGIGRMVNGFLRVVANIADVVGLDHVAGVLRDGADAAAGWGQGLAKGGAIGSPRRVGGGFVTDGPQAVVGEGNPMYPEFVIPTDPKYRNRAINLLLAAKEKVVPSHAAGTNRLDVEGGGPRAALAGSFTGQGILDHLKEFGADVLENLGDAILDAASWTLDQVRKLGRAGLEKAWPNLPVPDGLGGIPPSAMNTVRAAVLDLLWDKTPPAPTGGDTGGGVPYDGSGRIGSGYEQITGYLDSRGMDYTVTSAYRPGDPGFHGRGKAVDLVGDMSAIFHTLAPVPGINELFFDPIGWFIDEGSRHSGAIGGHDDHVHAATFDTGFGVLYPGWNLAYNGTGAMEAMSAVPMARGGTMPDLSGSPAWRAPSWTPPGGLDGAASGGAGGAPGGLSPREMDAIAAAAARAAVDALTANPVRAVVSTNAVEAAMYDDGWARR